MKAFDTDILTQILRGDTKYLARVSAIPVVEQSIPILVAEEVLRGRLNIIRQAESGKTKFTIEQAYGFFEETLSCLHEMTVLSYIARSETLYQTWRQTKIRGSTHDLRIAAVCVSHQATLVTRNRRDFEKVPGLTCEFWD